MLRKSYFMDGETLMVSQSPDSTTVTTRPATKEEEADYMTPEGAAEPESKPKKVKK